MINGSTDWRDDAVAMMQAAARALRHGPLPRECRTAAPIPYGRSPADAQMLADARDVVDLGAALTAIACAGLTAIQRDLVWDRALGLSWKEIDARNPGVPRRSLERWHADALAAVSTQLRKQRK